MGETTDSIACEPTQPLAGQTTGLQNPIQHPRTLSDSLSSYKPSEKAVPVRWKCHHCFTIIPDEKIVDGKCPVCNQSKFLKKMCENDHVCTCADTVQPGIHVCEKCGAFTCACGAENSVVVSRVTGFEVKMRSCIDGNLSEVGGWNQAKKNELIARTRYNVA
jgi:hypothetical protein